MDEMFQICGKPMPISTDNEYNEDENDDPIPIFANDEENKDDNDDGDISNQSHAEELKYTHTVQVAPAAAIKIYCPVTSCKSSFGEMKNWRKHFRLKHVLKLNDSSQVQYQLKEEDAEKIAKKDLEDRQLIAHLKEEKRRLEVILNRTLIIRASQKLVRKYKKIALKKTIVS